MVAKKKKKKKSTAELFSGLTCLLVSGDITICPPVLTFKGLTHLP